MALTTAPAGTAAGWPEGVTEADAEQLQQWGITPEEAQEARDALPELLAAAKAAKEGDMTGALQHLAAAIQVAPELTRKAMAEMTGLDDPDLPALLGQLASGDWSGVVETLKQATGLQDEVLNALAQLPQVKQLLDRIGISNPGPALRDAIALAQAIESGDVSDITEAALSLAGEFDPSVLPDSVRAFFQNPDIQNIARTLANDPNLPALIEQLVNGDWSGALQTLKGDSRLQGTVLDALADIPQVKQLLDSVGIQDPGAALEDVLDLGRAINEGDVAGSVNAAVNLASKLDPELLSSLIDKLPVPDQARQLVHRLAEDGMIQSVITSPQFGPAIAALAQGDPGGAIKALAQDPRLVAQAGARLAELLGLPQGVMDTLMAAADLLEDADIGPILGDFAAALANGRPEDALAALQRLAGAIPAADPQKLIHLLDAMGHLPGGLGKLFQDHELNAAIVKSGSAGKLVEAAQLLAEGRLEDAAGALYEAGASLLNYGDQKIEVGGQVLPFTVEGITQFAHLFGRFFDALPNGVKNAIMDVIGRAVGSAVPILGDLVTGAMDAGAFIDAIQNGDGVDQLLAGGQLALDGANTLQLTKAFTEPLKFALAALQAVRTINDMAQVVSNFQSVFFGLADDPDQAVKTQDQAVVDAYFGGPSDPGLATLVEAAVACHVDPAHFEAFVNALKNGASADDVIAFLADARGDPQGLRQRVSGLLQGQDLGALGGRWATTAFEIGNPDGYVTPEAQAQFEQATGGEIPVDTWSAEAISPYEGLVALARSLGIPGDQFGAFVAYLKAQGVDVRALADEISSRLTPLSAGPQDPPVFDAADWLRNGFTADHPGLVEQFQAQREAPG